MTMAAATRNSRPKQRASRSIAASDNLRLDTLRHHRPERYVGLRPPVRARRVRGTASASRPVTTRGKQVTVCRGSLVTTLASYIQARRAARVDRCCAQKVHLARCGSSAARERRYLVRWHVCENIVPLVHIPWGRHWASVNGFFIIRSLSLGPDSKRKTYSRLGDVTLLRDARGASE